MTSVDAFGSLRALKAPRPRGVAKLQLGIDLSLGACAAAASGPPPPPSNFLLEDGASFLLLEDGSILLLE